MNDMDDVYICDLNLKPPKYEKDCDMVDICENIGATYNICYKGCYITGRNRCSIETRQNILQQYNAQKTAEKNEKELRKKQFNHDWKIAIFSTLGGAIAGFFASFLFWLLTK